MTPPPTGVSTLDPPESKREAAPGRASDYTALSKMIKDAGLLDRRPLYYVVRFSIVLGLFAGGWVAFALLGDSWWQLLVAAFMGIAFTQVAFLGHDVGHRQVFTSKRAAEVTGYLLGNLALCMSYGWWISKHTRHHANPNHEDEDPDVAVGVIVWSEDHAELPRNPIGKWFAARQAYLFFPILLLEGLQLHVQSFRALPDPDVKRKRLEATLLILHLAIYVTVLFLVLSPALAIAFIAVHQGIFGLYMGSSFAPNHKGMPMVDEKMDFLRKQVLTSRNVRGNVIVDYALGGLNYQIEHHLFPSMPMPNLRKAQPLVKEYCASVDVKYVDASVVESYGQILSYLHEVGEPLRQQRRQPRR
jgi:fatty acid desaturase